VNKDEYPISFCPTIHAALPFRYDWCAHVCIECVCVYESMCVECVNQDY
jgi:hypothetical protein